MRYKKPATSHDEQVARLQQRGLVIQETQRADHWLRHISYYRLSAYCLPFKQHDGFQPGIDFNAIAGLYIFDRKLRLLTLDAIERIEVSIRATITQDIAVWLGPFGHTQKNNFAPPFDHQRFMIELQQEEQRAKETFADHFRRKYTAEPHLPVWMATELLSFGSISRLYKAMQPTARQRIAATYSVDAQFLASWLHALTYLRNVCAHHKRLWNRELAIKPKIPTRKSVLGSIPDNSRIYCMLVIIRHMLTVVSPRCHWRDRLFELFEQHPTVPLAAMRIPADWRTTAFWTH